MVIVCPSDAEDEPLTPGKESTKDKRSLGDRVRTLMEQASFAEIDLEGAQDLVAVVVNPIIWVLSVAIVVVYGCSVLSFSGGTVEVPIVIDFRSSHTSKQQGNATESQGEKVSVEDTDMCGLLDLAIKSEAQPQEQELDDGDTHNTESFDGATQASRQRKLKARKGKDELSEFGVVVTSTSRLNAAVSGFQPPLTAEDDHDSRETLLTPGTKKRMSHRTSKQQKSREKKSKQSKGTLAPPCSYPENGAPLVLSGSAKAGVRPLPSGIVAIASKSRLDEVSYLAEVSGKKYKTLEKAIDSQFKSYDSNPSTASPTILV